MTMRNPQQAVDAMKELHDSGADVGLGQCLHTCRTAWGLSGGEPDAATQWAHTDKAHRHSGPAPLGAPVFWTGGTHGYGHVALSDGRGNVWSTDLPIPERVGLVPVGEVARAWPGHVLVGWASSLEGQTLPLQPAAAPA